MKRLSRLGPWILPLTAMVFLSFPSCRKPDGPEPDGADRTRSTAILQTAMDDYWRRMLDESNYLRLKLGLPIERLPDLSHAHARALADQADAMLKKLEEIDPAELNHRDRLSWEILKWHLDNTVRGLPFFWLGFPVTPYSSPIPGEHRVFTTFTFQTPEDGEHYLKLLRLYPVFIQGVEDKLRGQEERDIILPREELGLVIPFLSSFIAKAEASLFFVPDARLDKLENRAARDFQERVREEITSRINPALERLIGYLRGEYSEKAPDRVGLWQYPGGEEYYTYLVRLYTTRDYSPEEIHEIGIRNVRLNYDRIERVKNRIGFDGNLDEFIRFLKTDKRFFPATAEEIGDRLRSYIAGMDARIDQYFLRRPEAPFGTERLDPALEAAMTFGYYQPPTPTQPKGLYLYNGSTPEQRSLIQAESLIYHELVPGHHFQIALQSENENLPKFRRESFISAYSEGWAEYAAWLGREMGFYQDPYDLCGRYLGDMFLSARLVVDTGMNALKWPREKAAAYLEEASFFTPTQVETETLRYAVDLPGQALGYKMGSLMLADIRRKAEQALGDRFDIRRFHEAILGSGSMPFPILERHIDWFVEEEARN